VFGFYFADFFVVVVEDEQTAKLTKLTLNAKRETERAQGIEMGSRTGVQHGHEKSNNKRTKNRSQNSIQGAHCLRAGYSCDLA
jgi:hypothetical protein